MTKKQLYAAKANTSTSIVARFNPLFGKANPKNHFMVLLTEIFASIICITTAYAINPWLFVRVLV